jgi:hypothetical protein
MSGSSRFVLALMLALAASTAAAGEPVASPDALERDILPCVLKSAKTGKCMETMLGKRVVPGFDNLVSVATQMDELLVKWLDKETVYAIHPTHAKKVGEVFELRSYLIEDTSGALMVFEMALLKRLGKWYVYSMNINSNSDVVEKTLEGG